MASNRDVRARYTREDVLLTALRLLNDRGLPDLSMRALARELELQPSALYWHFKNKQELLAAVADEILAPVTELPDEVEAGEVAATFREAMLAVTDGAEVVVSTIALGLGADRAYERLRLSLEDMGHERDAAIVLATTLLHYCLGHASHEQQRAQALRLGVELEESPIEASSASFAAGLQRILS